MGSKKEGGQREEGTGRVDKKGLEEYLKRGREEEEVGRIEDLEEKGAEWAFSKNREVGRSPPVENRMSRIKELLWKIREEMNKRLAEVNNRGIEIRKEMKELKRKLMRERGGGRSGMRWREGWTGWRSR